MVKGCMAAGQRLMNDSSFLKINEVVNKALCSWHIVINMHKQMNQ